MTSWLYDNCDDASLRLSGYVTSWLCDYVLMSYNRDYRFHYDEHGAADFGWSLDNGHGYIHGYNLNCDSESGYGCDWGYDIDCDMTMTMITTMAMIMIMASFYGSV